MVVVPVSVTNGSVTMYDDEDDDDDDDNDDDDAEGEDDDDGCARSTIA